MRKVIVLTKGDLLPAVLYEDTRQVRFGKHIFEEPCGAEGCQCADGAGETLVCTLKKGEIDTLLEEGEMVVPKGEGEDRCGEGSPLFGVKLCSEFDFRLILVLLVKVMREQRPRNILDLLQDMGAEIIPVPAGTYPGRADKS